MEFYYSEDGSAVGTYNGLPYNFHPTETPEQWLWFLSELEDGNLREIPKPPEPLPEPTDPALVENQWREAEMVIAKSNVTAIEYGEEGIPGTEQDWKAYWLALRKWTQDANPDFPDSTKRPKAPQ